MAAAFQFLYHLLAFLSELAMLAALGYWGFHGDKKWFEKYGLGFGLPLLAIAVWAYWAAPKSTTRLDQPYLFLLKCALFGSAVYALYRSGYPVMAALFAVVALGTAVLEFFGVK